MQKTITSLALGGLLLMQEMAWAGNHQPTSKFDQFLRHVATVSCDEVSVNVKRFPLNVSPNLAISPNGLFFSLQLDNLAAFDQNDLEIISIHTGKSIKRFGALRAKLDHLIVAPAGAVWSPECNLCVQMAFSDEGSEWLTFDPTKRELTPDSKKHLDRMLNATQEFRDDDYCSQKWNGPDWNMNGQLVGNGVVAVEKLGELWKAPKFAGRSRTRVFAGNGWYDIFLGDATSLGHLPRMAYIFSYGILVEETPSAYDYCPDGGFFYYDKGDLVMVAFWGLLTSRSGPEKVIFQNQRLDDMRVVEDAGFEDVIISTKSPTNRLLYIMRIKAGE